MNDLVIDIMNYEDRNLSGEDIIILFSKLIKNKYSLQGHYGRTAVKLINAGILDKEGNILETKLNQL